MESRYIVLLFFFLLLVECYFFCMQRVLLEAGRIKGVKLDFLLPHWYGIGTVVSIAKFAAIVWICFISVGLAVFLFIFSFLAKAMCPIPRNIYSRIFKNQMDESNIPADVRTEIYSALLAVGVRNIGSASNNKCKDKLSDLDAKEASDLRMNVNHYRIYKEIYDEQMRYHAKKITPPDRTSEIPNMNEWRRYGEYRYRKSSNELYDSIKQ